MDPDHKTSRRHRGTRPGSTAAARELRRETTAAEAALWEALRSRRVDGLKFRRQHAVGPYILDFYCPAHKLAIEVDGAVHDRTVEYDEARTQHLSGYGYRVLRFRNDEVLHDLRSVLARILRTAKG